MKPLEVRRGDIYFLDIPHYTGSEMGKNRPAIVVSCDAINRTSPCVTVVCCSGSNQHADLPEHVDVTSTPRPSLALCEHIYTVDKSRLGDYLGALSPQELAGVDRGIALGLFGALEGLQVGSAEARGAGAQRAPQTEKQASAHTGGIFGEGGSSVPSRSRRSVTPKGVAGANTDLLELTSARCRSQIFQEQAAELRLKLGEFSADVGRVEAQRDLLRELYDGLLDRVLGESA